MKFQIRFANIRKFPGYRVDSTGGMWSKHRSGWKSNTPAPKRWRKLKTSPDKDGYLLVNLYKNKKHYTRKVHHLVLEAFVGKRPKGMQCRHVNGIRNDNRWWNLRWATSKRNMRDKIRHGTRQIGEKGGNAKLTEKQVMLGRKLRRKFNTPFTRLSKKFIKASYFSTYEAVTGRKWKHLPGAAL